MENNRGRTTDAQKARIISRSKYIKKYVKQSPLKTSDAVAKLAKKLFLSEDTIYRDLVRKV